MMSELQGLITSFYDRQIVNIVHVDGVHDFHLTLGELPPNIRRKNQTTFSFFGVICGKNQTTFLIFGVILLS